MAMIIAWQTVNAARHPGGKTFSRGFLVVAPGITIRDRLRVLQPNDPESYYRHREIVPPDMLGEIDKAKIVITNYHAFKLRERLEVAKGTRNAIEGWRRENPLRQFHDLKGNPLADRSAQMPRQLGRVQQRLGGRILPRRRGASESPRLCEEPEARARSPLPHGVDCAPLHPDFIVQVDDGKPDPLNLIVEIKRFRGENAKDKANAMRVYWIPSANNLGRFGRWAFAEFKAVYEIEAEFAKLIASV